MTGDHGPAAWLKRARANSETLLRESPRTLEFACALSLGTLALMLFFDFALHRWFYLRFHQYYRTTPASRIYDLARACCEILMGAWLVAITVDLSRGASHRHDRGLFAPTVLRAWGVVFALIPIGIVAAYRDAVHYLHLLLWFWSATIACFVLAARRGQGSPSKPTTGTQVP
jgi:hypothetical protein